MSSEPLLLALLVWGIFPLWLMAGGADWLCHRASRIDRTSGVRESLFHLVMFAQIALPVVAALFLRLNALMLVLCGAAVLAHMATTLLDTTYSQPRRHISPIEQQVHSYLEMLPLFAFAIVLVIHWGEWRQPEWRFAARETRLPTVAVAVTLVALLVTLILICEEIWRCWRTAKVARTQALS